MTVGVLIHLPNLWGFLMIQLCSLFWVILPHTSHIFLQWYVSLVGAVTIFCIWMFPKWKKCASTSVVIELSLVLLSSTVNLWNRLIHSSTSVLYKMKNCHLLSMSLSCKRRLSSDCTFFESYELSMLIHYFFYAFNWASLNLLHHLLLPCSFCEKP